MIRVKEVTDKYQGDFEGRINRILIDIEKNGWKFIDIKHSIAPNGRGGIISSALIIFDDTPTADTSTSLNQ